MGKEYRAKSFKSGNSVAIRMPAALGIEPDKEWMIVEIEGNLVVKPATSSKKTIDVSGFAGKMPWLKLPSREDFEERPSTIARRARAAE